MTISDQATNAIAPSRAVKTTAAELPARRGDIRSFTSSSCGEQRCLIARAFDPRARGHVCRFLCRDRVERRWCGSGSWTASQAPQVNASKQNKRLSRP